MGQSKSWKAAPGWESRNTPRGETKVSKGAVVNAEGTHQSGNDDSGRAGMKRSTKSSSSEKSGKTKGIYGQS